MEQQKITFLKPKITETEIDLINRLITDNPSWGRSRLSRELCQIWRWQSHDGSPKDISCRDLLRDLDFKGIIKLPLQQHNARRPGCKDKIQFMIHDTTSLSINIQELMPLKVEAVFKPGFKLHEFKSLIEQYHYLGFDMTVGENMKYMIYGQNGRLLACLLFGSSAWSCAPRERFIEWSEERRKSNLHLTTNNTRFLILPWVKVPHLASHILGLVCRRIANDWQTKYGHPVYLLETFVEKDRFKGTCYKAANWQYVGQTTGRSRNDRYNKLRVPIKDIYLYPLTRDFREVLQNATHA
jgi:hypothetical protein